MKKMFCFLLFLIFTTSNLILANLVIASIPNPSVPEFTLKAVANAIEVTVKNQALTPYQNGGNLSLYYGFRFKDHNAGIGFWDYDPPYFVLPSTYGGYYNASASDSTIVSLSLEGYRFPSRQIDLQAVALVGNQYPNDIQNGIVFAFEGVTSDWSSIQTLAIPALTSSPLPTPDTVPQQPEPSPTTLIIASSVLVAAVCISLFDYFKKRKSEAKTS